MSKPRLGSWVVGRPRDWNYTGSVPFEGRVVAEGVGPDVGLLLVESRHGGWRGEEADPGIRQRYPVEAGKTYWFCEPQYVEEAESPPPETASIGQLLRRMRQDAGLTQRQLARRVGMAQSKLCDLENGKRRRGVKVRDIAAIAAATGFEATLK